MMEKKLQKVQASLKEEKKYHKKADETISQLLKKNEIYKQQLSESESNYKKTETQCKKLDKQLKKQQNINKEDKTTIKELKYKLKTSKSDSSEAFKLLRKMEQDHEQQI